MPAKISQWRQELPGRPCPIGFRRAEISAPRMSDID
jgi:hypothetical protein